MYSGNLKRKYEGDLSTEDANSYQSDNSVENEQTENEINKSQSVVSQTELLVVKDMLEMAHNLLGIVSPAPVDLKFHKSFQPNFTQEDNFRRIYLAWNVVGIITSRKDSDSNVIQIHFQNSMGANKNILFRDINSYTLAAISYDGAIFANEFDGEEETETDEQQPNIYYYSFPNSLIPNESFKARLLPGERALAVAVGSGFISVATSTNLLRIFSSTGLPLKIVWLSGTPVCLCGLKGQLAVIYQNNYVLNLDMYLTSWEVGIQNITEIAKHVSLPLFGTQKLTWLGFSSDTMLLTILDSHGHLSILSKTALGLHGWSWTPVLDLTADVCTRFWPTTVQSNSISYVPLEGNLVPQRNHNQLYPNVSHMQFCSPLLDFENDPESSSKSMQQLVWKNVVYTHCHYVALDNIIALRSVQHMQLDADLYDLSVITEVENQIDLLLVNKLMKAVQNDRKERQLDLMHSIRSDKGLSTALLIGKNYRCSTVIESASTLINNKNPPVEEINCTSEIDQDDTFLIESPLTKSHADSVAKQPSNTKFAVQPILSTIKSLPIKPKQLNPLKWCDDVSIKDKKSTSSSDRLPKELTLSKLDKKSN
jgi:hypothetical protein